MSFRSATPDDAELILTLLFEFHQKSGGIYGVAFDPASEIYRIARVMRDGVCLVGPSSCAGALIEPFPSNHQARVAQVHFWYFRKAREIRIFEALMEACRAAGATHIASYAQADRPTIARWYKKFGLQPAEICFMGKLHG